MACIIGLVVYIFLWVAFYFLMVNLVQPSDKPESSPKSEGAQHYWKLHLQDLPNVWQREGHTLVIDPIPVRCRGDYRTGLSPQYIPGGIGITETHLLFADLSCNGFAIPLNTIRWLFPRQNNTGFTLYIENKAGWSIYDFASLSTSQLAQYLEEQHRIVAPNMPPIDNVWWGKYHKQDIYGVWTVEGVVQFCLLPDRLLGDWQEIIHFSQIRRLVAISLEQSAMLRIEFERPDRQTIGLEMPAKTVEVWGDTLARLTTLPLEYETGRKKKEVDSLEETILPEMFDHKKSDFC